MPRSRLLLGPAAALALFALVPASAAEAACGVPQSRALHETPDVQVYASRGRAVACMRATGRARVVGPRSSGRTTFVRGVVGGRWLHVVRAGAGGTSEADLHQLVDLRTGRRAQVAERRRRLETLALPGVLVTAVGDERGVVARTTTGRRTVLSRAGDAEGIAAAGDRVYWLESGGATTRSATVAIATSAPAGDPPALQRIGRCPADASSTLLLHDRSRVVSESAAGLRVCNRWTGRRWTVDGADTAFAGLSADGLAYRTPATAGLLRFTTSARVELPVPAEASAVASATFLAGATAEGLRLLDARRADQPAQTLDPGAVTDLAAASVPSSTSPDDETVVYWTDAGGQPRSAAALTR